MAYKSILLLIISVSTQINALTCPGFPGYCSESFVGQTCVVVCAKGRPNVPLCQDDGTWTDIPRCIEHEPGKDEQIPGLCPGIGGYCSDGFLHQRCNFRCDTGKLIDSKCTQDGTWQPYPTCPGDLRETQDGCNPCPGPAGGSRNRTLEGLQNNPRAQIDRRVKAQQAALDNRFLGINSGGRRQQQPSNTIDTGNRVVRPTFAGSLAFGRSTNPTNTQSNVPSRSNAQSFIPTQTQRPKPIPAPTPPAPTTRRPVNTFRQQTASRPSSRPQQSFSSESDTTVIEPQRTSPFLSIGPDGRIRADSDPNLSNTKTSGPAPNSFQQQSSRQNQFSSGFSQQRNQNMFGQTSRGRRPQSSFTPEQRKIIQSALSKLPKSVRGGSNFFNQQMQNQQPMRQQSSQSQFANFPQRQTPMSRTTMAPRRLNFNPLREQRPQMQQIQPQSSRRARPQPPTPPPRQSIQRQRQSIQPQRQSRPSLPEVNPQPQPRVQPTQSPRPAAPKKKLSALQQILALQSKKGPTGAKNGGTPPPPTERPKPQQVMLFQEDNFNPRSLQSENNGDSFGVFPALNLGLPTENVQNGPQLQAFPAIPNSARSSRVQAANDRFEGNSQFGVFETVQL